MQPSKVVAKSEMCNQSSNGKRKCLWFKCSTNKWFAAISGTQIKMFVQFPKSKWTNRTFRANFVFLLTSFRSTKQFSNLLIMSFSFKRFALFLLRENTHKLNVKKPWKRKRLERHKEIVIAIWLELKSFYF